MRFDVTVRYGRGVQRYHLLTVEAPDAALALRRVADLLPPDVASEADLVELRSAVDPDDRDRMGAPFPPAPHPPGGG